MSIKPIEPGCLCMIKVGEHSGETVTAIRVVKIGELIEGFYRSKKGGWLVEKGDLIGVYKESGLMRIDSGDPDAGEVESQDQEVDCHASA
tara:strand:+ start:132 stop:401 length:270 start_codon:yes stop_codon:yes gene_type:complete